MPPSRGAPSSDIGKASRALAVGLVAFRVVQTVFHDGSIRGAPAPMNDDNEERKSRVIPLLAAYMVIAFVFILILIVKIVHGYHLPR
jgi:hypothetical protein